MKKYLINYIEKNIKNILVIVSFMVIGVILGIVAFNVTNEEIKNLVITEVNNTLNIAKENNYEGVNLVLNELKYNIILIAIIYIFSFTFIPNILVNITSFLKGAKIGFVISLGIKILGVGNGLLFSLLVCILPNIIYIPAYIYVFNNVLLLNNSIINEGIKLGVFSIEVVKIIISLSNILLGILIEQICFSPAIAIYFK